MSRENETAAARRSGDGVSLCREDIFLQRRRTRRGQRGRNIMRFTLGGWNSRLDIYDGIARSGCLRFEIVSQPALDGAMEME
jgi:hypothetical protein